MGSNIFIESLYDIYWMKNIAEFSKLDLIIAILNGYIIYLLLMNDSLDNRLIDNVNFKLCGIRDGLLRHQSLILNAPLAGTTKRYCGPVLPSKH